tara:strand:- start:2010 stop:2321 length:312 start_codon:yes stop_codon:yes gene_type:complete
MAESEIPDNQKTKDNNSTLSNYIIATITAVVYSMAKYPETSPINLFAMFDDSIWFFGNLIAALIGPAIFAGIYYLIKRKGFSKVFAWATVVLLFLSYVGSRIE